VAAVSVLKTETPNTGYVLRAYQSLQILFCEKNLPTNNRYKVLLSLEFQYFVLKLLNKK